MLVTQLLLGVWPVVGAIVLRELTPRALVGARVLLAAPILFVLAQVWRSGMARGDVGKCLGLGVIGVVCNQLAFVEGLHRSTPLHGAVLGCLVPVWTLVVGALFGLERPRRQQVVGVGVAMAGALWMVWQDHLEFGPERLHGILLLMTSGVVYGAYLVLSRPLIARHGARAVLGWVFAGAAVAVLPLVGADLALAPWPQLSASAWMGLGYIVLGATVVAYLLNSFALGRVSATSAAVFSYSQPFITGLAAGTLLGQKPTWQIVVAALAIFAGVGLVFGVTVLGRDRATRQQT